MSTLARWKPIVGAVALGLAAAVAYLALADRRYEAEATLQVVPLPADESTFTGFALPRTGGASAAETVADLVRRPVVVDAAAVRLRLDRGRVLDALSVSADRSSNVVAVRAEMNDPRRAAQVANAVADEFVAERSAVFQGELNRTIDELRDRLRSLPAAERDPADVARLAALEASLGQRDPTVRVAGNAVARDRAVWPRPIPVLAAAVGLSLVLGVGVAAALAAAARPATPEGAALARREAALAQRVRAVTARERELARRAGDLAKRERQLERRAGAAAPPPPPRDRGPERVSQRPAEPAAPVPDTVRDGAWNVVALERLVAERGAEFPERLEEWRAHVFFLREHASPEGLLPHSFDALVDETFRELL